MIKSNLNNGLTIISDIIPHFETVSVGIFINVGSVNENFKQKGISHFLEHMLFKGTKNRSAFQISQEIESVGGIINAFTSQEITAFHVKMLKDNFELGIDIITEMFQYATFEDFDKERKVIIEEIKMVNDSPQDLVFDMFQSQCFNNEQLGFPVLGFEKDILSYVPDDLRKYMDDNYSIDKMVLVASGNINHDSLCKVLEHFTKNLKIFETKSVPIQYYQGGYIFKEKNLEQNHLILGYEGFSYNNENKYALMLLSKIIGEGSSSRLFQEIREKKGLVYSIYSTVSCFRDTGTFGIYAACNKSNVKEVIEIINKEFNKIQNGITISELNKAKMQLKSQIFIDQENSSVKIENIAFQHLLEKKLQNINEIIYKIDSVTIDIIKEVLISILKTKPTLALLGKEINDIYEFCI